jgi:hypothetical protein
MPVVGPVADVPPPVFIRRVIDHFVFFSSERKYVFTFSFSP